MGTWPALDESKQTKAGLLQPGYILGGRVVVDARHVVPLRRRHLLNSRIRSILALQISRMSFRVGMAREDGKRAVKLLAGAHRQPLLERPPRWGQR